MNRSVIIYKGNFQYDAVNIFADELAEGFNDLSIDTFVIDLRNTQTLAENLKNALSGTDCRLICAFAGIGAELKASSGAFFHDTLKIPFAALSIDHPVHMLSRAAQKNMQIGCYDESHINFLDIISGGQLSAFHFPHGGCICQEPFTGTYSERPVEVFFPASYINPGVISKLDSLPPHCRDIGLSAVDIILEADSMPVHEAIIAAGIASGIDVKIGEGFRILLDVMEKVFIPVELHTRGVKRIEVLKILDNAGISVEICGSNWPDGLFKNHKVSPPMDFKSVLRKMSESKVVLNAFMIPGSHERLLSAALAGAHVLGDYSPWPFENFFEGREMSFYRWTKRNMIPEAVRGILSDIPNAEAVAKAGQLKTRNNHTWKNRARSLAGRFGL